VSDPDEEQLESLDRRIKAALGPHGSLRELGDGDLWAFSEHGDAPISIHELGEIERRRLEQGTPEGRV
jgi:hypothetical protein